jgi:hypothetical protein
LIESFDDLVGAGEERWWDLKIHRFGRLEVDDQFVFGGCLDRKVGWFLTLEDAIDIASGAPVAVERIRLEEARSPLSAI